MMRQRDLPHLFVEFSGGKMIENRGMEILAPAGNLDILKGVVNAGADAVYFGGDLFGARAFAANFDLDDAAEGIRYAHLFGAKAYLTVNTLLKNLEVEKKLHAYLEQYRDLGIDAVIVQDMAVLELLRTDFPDLAIHASTQMSICGQGAKMLNDLGVERVVTARELSLNEIADIYAATGMEIETFVHGALCYCYSGQCLFSSLAGGRSGNRGRCAQPCRQPYDLYDACGKVKTQGPYILSPKDLCGIRDIKKLYDAGVYSLKIEGRMKQKEYAAGVVGIYRKYVDRFLENPSEMPAVSSKDYNTLMSLGNRCGFTDDYYSKPNSREMICFTDPSHKKDGQPIELPERKIHLKGRFTAHLNEPAALELFGAAGEAFVTGDIVQKVLNRPTGREEIEEKLNAFGNTVFALDTLDIEMDSDIFLPGKSLKTLRRQATEALEKRLLDKNRRQENAKALIAKEKERPLFQNQIVLRRWETDPAFRLFVSCKNVSQLSAALEFDFVETLCLDSSAAFSLTSEELRRIRQRGKNLYVKLPDIMRHLTDEMTEFLRGAQKNFDGLLVPSYDGLEFAASNMPGMHVICDHRIYTYSNASLAAFRKLGLCDFCAPLELNLGELKHRDNSSGQFIIYGYLPLMITAGCMNRSTYGCTKESKEYLLKDQKGHSFACQNDCNTCTSTIYNSDVLCLFDELDAIAACGFSEYRMDFTTENGEKVGNILTSYGNMINKKRYILPANRTKGHLYRGVE